MSNERFIVVKSISHSAEDLVKLHEFLNSSKARSPIPLDGWLVEREQGPLSYSQSAVAGTPDAEKFPFAELLSSSFDKKHGTYTVEVKLWLSRPAKGYSTSIGSYEFADVLCPRSIPLELFALIGEFPEDGNIVPR